MTGHIQIRCFPNIKNQCPPQISCVQALGKSSIMKKNSFEGDVPPYGVVVNALASRSEI